MKRGLTQRGFSLAEGLLMLIVMGFITATVIPATIKKKSDDHYHGVIVQLGKIEAAKQEAAFANNWPDNRKVSIKHDLLPRYLASDPTQPDGGIYNAGRVNTPVTYEGKTADEWRAACSNNPEAQSCGL